MVAKVCLNKSKLLDLFRRTRATTLYQNGVELPLVSRMLGHAQLETTLVYATPSMEMMRNALEANTQPFTKDETPLWDETADKTMAKICGLR